MKINTSLRYHILLTLLLLSMIKGKHRRQKQLYDAVKGKQQLWRGSWIYKSCAAPQHLSPACGSAPAVAHRALTKTPAPFLSLQKEGFLGRGREKSTKTHILDKHKLLSLDKRLGEWKNMNVCTTTIA